jgi:hypothetical protein
MQGLADFPIKILYIPSLEVEIFLILSTVCYLLILSPLRVSLLSFSGSTVIVLGTSKPENPSVNGTNLSWQCFIDSVNIGRSPPPTFILPTGSDGTQNNWMLCGNNEFQDGLHLLTVAVTNSGQDAFQFDRNLIVPSASVTVNGSFLRIDATDSAIKYSPGWDFSSQWTNLSMPNLNSSYTKVSGSTLTLQFCG